MSASVPAKKETEKLERLVSGAASLRRPIYRILAFCKSPQQSEAIESEVAACMEGQVLICQRAAVLQWLKDAGAIEPVEAQDGQPCPLRWVTTAAGSSVLETASPSKQIADLMDGRPQYADSYYRMLVFCLVARSRTEIEKHFEGDPALVMPKVYPEVLIGDLEEVGALEWTGKWRTTDLAKEYLQ